jgi:AraC-like DNA-binding protein/quercetin dioxygenase-like cupin family protein
VHRVADYFATTPRPAGAIVVGAFPMGAGVWFGAHAHPQHQVAWTARGVVAVTIGSDHWVLPPTRALWIPAGVVHRTGATRQAAMHGVYLDPARCRVGWTVPTAVPVGRLLGELIVHLCRDDLGTVERAHAEEVVLDLLQPLPTTAVTVPMPADDRASRVAEALLADPADDRSLDALARAAGTSTRTLSRLFVQDTGLSFNRWRTRLRMQAALPLLADGQPVQRVAREVGYATPSAFVAAFRRTLGMSPGRYLGSR